MVEVEFEISTGETTRFIYRRGVEVAANKGDHGEQLGCHLSAIAKKHVHNKVIVHSLFPADHCLLPMKS